MTIAARPNGMKCLRQLKHWDHRFESHSRHTRLLYLYCPVSVASLSQADAPAKESHPSRYKEEEEDKVPILNLRYRCFPCQYHNI
jgi:hypothetical protein